MTVKCAVLKCRSGYKKKRGETTSFKRCVFRFPKNEAVRSLWLKALGRKDFNASQAGICEKHFNASDIRRDEGTGEVSRSRLKPGAVPSIFEHTADADTTSRDLARPTKLSSSSARRSREEERLQNLLAEFQDRDSVNDIPELQTKLKDERLPAGFRLVPTCF